MRIGRVRTSPHQNKCDSHLNICLVFTVPLKVRQRLILDVLSSRTTSGASTPGVNSALSVLVKRLQESLTRMESFEVVTVSPSGDGMLSCCLRLVYKSHRRPPARLA